MPPGILRGNEMTTTVITGIVCFLIGGLCGVFCMALMVIRRSNED